MRRAPGEWYESWRCCTASSFWLENASISRISSALSVCNEEFVPTTESHNKKRISLTRQLRHRERTPLADLGHLWSAVYDRSGCGNVSRNCPNSIVKQPLGLTELSLKLSAVTENLLKKRTKDKERNPNHNSLEEGSLLVAWRPRHVRNGATQPPFPFTISTLSISSCP